MKLKVLRMNSLSNVKWGALWLLRLLTSVLTDEIAFQVAQAVGLRIYLMLIYNYL